MTKITVEEINGVPMTVVHKDLGNRTVTWRRTSLGVLEGFCALITV